MTEFNVAARSPDGRDEATDATRGMSQNGMDRTAGANSALSNAASEVVRMAQSVGKTSADTFRSVSREAAKEMQQRPIASIAAALTAGGALVGMILAVRGSKQRSSRAARFRDYVLKRK